jgi:hypothetical protein
MDTSRILDGESTDECGNHYNGKILGMQREISETDSIAKYSYQVVILANLTRVTNSELRKLTGGYACHLFDHEQSYQKLVFPVISGTYYNATEIQLNIDLSNKNAGSKISYTVYTSKGECEITVLFVPTIEIGRIMFKYKNSILRYNPRSYLGHEGKNVNNAIFKTITDKQTNEFALFNNGITILSNETSISEKIASKNRAQLVIKNPQIINGGQTSYTLSRIYGDNLQKNIDKIFQNKEVLVKVITLKENKDEESMLQLINDISEATNKQTPVINADKLSNDKLQLRLQSYLFDNFGVLYERKRGEFADGLLSGYITEADVLERNLFFRLYFASLGRISKAKEKKLFMKTTLTFEELISYDLLKGTYFAYLCFNKLEDIRRPQQKIDISTYAKVYAMTLLYKPDKISDYPRTVDQYFSEFSSKWKDFLSSYRNKPTNTRSKTNKITGSIMSYQTYDYQKWYGSEEFRKDLQRFYKDGKLKELPFQNAKDDDHVWYVAYNENVGANRFSTFILGGRISGYPVQLKGCADKALPLKAIDATIAFPLYFGRFSKKDGQGRAFIVPEKTEGAVTHVKMYLVTKSQFVEIVSQENMGREIMVNFDDAIQDGESVIAHGAPYGKMLFLGNFEGAAAFTFFPDKTNIARVPPAESYVEELTDALKAGTHLSADLIKRYILERVNSGYDVSDNKFSSEQIEND